MIRMFYIMDVSKFRNTPCNLVSRSMDDLCCILFSKSLAVLGEFCEKHYTIHRNLYRFGVVKKYILFPIFYSNLR